MTHDEIKHLEETVSGNIARNMIDTLWHKAFVFYNQNNEKKLRFTCRPCYQKVLDYCKANMQV